MTEALLSSVQKQIEFYFSDSNFRKDAFLRTGIYFYSLIHINIHITIITIIIHYNY